MATYLSRIGHGPVERPSEDALASPQDAHVRTDGHVTLSDRRLVTVRDGHREEAQVDDPLRVLDERFGIRLPRWPGS